MEQITFKDLLPCDVLLCRGNGMLSDAIVALDGGSYSHSAFFDGSGLVQATSRGVVKDDIGILKEETYVDVFRFIKQHHQIGDAGWPAEPVVKEADQIAVEGHKYAFDHLFLLGLVAISRRIPMVPFEKKLLRIILDHAINVLFKVLDEGKEPMVCSEVVYRCFAEALPIEKYQLEIKGTLLDRLGGETKPEASHSTLHTLAEVDGEELMRLEHSKTKFLETWHKAKTKDNRGDGDLAVASCVTPHDLEISPNLLKIGRYSFG